MIEELPEGSAALLLIIEHAWAVPLREAVVDAGGVLLANKWLGAQELITLGVALGIVADKELMAPGDRPIEIVNGGKVIKDIVA